jgi:hypothetical protein
MTHDDDLSAFGDAVAEALRQANAENLDRMRDMVRKLLAKAENAATPAAEAEALTDKAFDIMARYGLTKALLDANDPNADVVGDKHIDVPGPYAGDKVFLLQRICEGLGLRIVLTGTNGPTRRVHLFGMGADLERVDILWTLLLVQCTNELAKHTTPRNVTKVAYTKAFIIGYALEIKRRLQEAAQRARDDVPTTSTGPGVDIVLAGRANQVDKRMREVYPRLRNVKSRRSYNQGAGEAGRAAGQRADLGGQRFGRRAAGALSS